MLQNAYLIAKIGADTAENEHHFAEILPIGRRVAEGEAGGPRRGERAGQPALEPCDPSHGYAARRCSRYLLDRICQNVDKMLAVLGCIGADICNKLFILQHISNALLHVIHVRCCKRKSAT